MNEYVPISEKIIERWSAKWLRRWLLKAQAEIERLNEEGDALKHPERRISQRRCYDGENPWLRLRRKGVKDRRKP